MSTPNKQLIAAIQRIAEGSPLFTEVRGLLKEIQRRGGIEGLSLKIGADDESGGDCCTDPNETGEPTEPTAPDIGGDAPPDMSGGTPEGWSDCETGEAIQFTPAGFAQVETCKGDPVCEHDDPTYSAGTYWQTNGSPPSVSKSAIQAAKMDHDKFYSEGSGYFYGIRGGPDSYVMLRYVYAFGGYVAATTTSIVRYPCGDNPEGIFAEVCSGGFDPSCVQYAENGDMRPSDPATPPMWESDNSTSYTLVNGCIVASSCDTDASEQAKQCNECITICNDQGQQRVICSTPDGGFIMTDPNGTHDGGKYDANGKRTEILKAGSTGGYDGGTFGVGDGWVWN